jgi:hypothetical protein
VLAANAFLVEWSVVAGSASALARVVESLLTEILLAEIHVCAANCSKDKKLTIVDWHLLN